MLGLNKNLRTDPLRGRLPRYRAAHGVAPDRRETGSLLGIRPESDRSVKYLTDRSTTVRIMTTTADDLRRVALQEFATAGYLGTSLQQIADRAGVSKATVLYHFSSKEVLLEAVLSPRSTSWTASWARSGSPGCNAVGTRVPSSSSGSSTSCSSTARRCTSSSTRRPRWSTSRGRTSQRRDRTDLALLRRERRIGRREGAIRGRPGRRRVPARRGPRPRMPEPDLGALRGALLKVLGDLLAPSPVSHVPASSIAD